MARAGRALVRPLLLACAVLFGASGPAPAHAEKVLIAAAADLKYALDEIVLAYRKTAPGAELEVVYGSSGKFHTQIQQGAPYDLYFSADIALPHELVRAGLAASDVRPYGRGRIVLWSTRADASRMTLASLADPGIVRVAIANPRHAPYGRRAEEALRALGIWDKVAPKLVYGENVSQAAQFVHTGNAQVGIIALSLASNPELARLGGYALIPEHLHEPLQQGFIITRRAAGNALARRFADYIESEAARDVLARYGFVPPGQAPGAPLR